MNKNDRQPENAAHVSRRWFMEQCGMGMGAMALQHLLARLGATDRLELRRVETILDAERERFLNL